MQENNYSLNIKNINILTDEENIGRAVASVVKYYFKKLIEMNQNISRANISIDINDKNITIQNDYGKSQTISRKDLERGL